MGGQVVLLPSGCRFLLERYYVVGAMENEVEWKLSLYFFFFARGIELDTADTSSPQCLSEETLPFHGGKNSTGAEGKV